MFFAFSLSFSSLFQSSPLVAEDLFLTYGFLNCNDYGVMVEGIVPVSLKSEQIVVNSVLESFECG